LLACLGVLLLTGQGFVATMTATFASLKPLLKLVPEVQSSDRKVQ
jgi:hypothetical protein